MIDRISTVPLPAPPLRLHAWYGSAGALLRELSRALNQGQSLLRADSGLPVGTRMVLVMSAECLTGPIEVEGTVTSRRARGRHCEMTLRYDFDPGSQRGRLDEALAELRAQTRRPRRSARVPLTLSADSTALARGMRVTVIDVSHGGARLRVEAARPLGVAPGDRLVLCHRGERPGTRRSLRLILDVRWTQTRRSGRRAVQVIGGRFVEPSDPLRKRLRALLRFEETRPRLGLIAVRPGRRDGQRPPTSRRRVLKR